MDIEEDILQAAKEIARHEHSTAGQVISRLARQGLKKSGSRTKDGFIIRNGIPVFPSRGEIITNDLINRIREEEGI